METSPEKEKLTRELTMLRGLLLSQIHDISLTKQQILECCLDVNPHLSDTNKWNETIDSVQEKNFVSQKKNKLRLTELGFDYLVEHVSIRDVLAPILDNPKAQLLIRVVDSIESFLAEEEEQDEDPSSSYSPTPKPRFYYPDPSEN